MEEGARIAEAFWVALGTVFFLGFCLYLLRPVSEDGPARGSVWWQTGTGLLVMIWDRYVVTSPDAMRDARRVAGPGSPLAAPTALRTEGAARADAVQGGAARASTPPAAAPSGALPPDFISLIQRIAAHKIVRPADGKEATGKALGIGKSGTSAAWQSYSQAWNLLYPPPVVNVIDASDPLAWESDGSGQMRRIRTAAR